MDINNYIESVCSHVRYKRAHARLSEELRTHLEEQAEAYAAQGMDQPAALQKAIAEMGDPHMVGVELDKVHRPRLDLRALLPALGIIAVGLFVQQIMNGTLGNVDSTLPGLMARQALYSLLGLPVLLLAYKFDYTRLISRPKLFCAMTALSIVPVLAMKFSYTLAFLPYYIVLLQAPVYAGIVYASRNDGGRGLAYCLSLLAASFGLYAFIGGNDAASYLFITCCCITALALLKGWFGIERKQATIISCAMLLIFLLWVVLPFGGGFYDQPPAAGMLAQTRPFGTMRLNAEQQQMYDEGFVLHNIIRVSQPDAYVPDHDSILMIAGIYGYVPALAVLLLPLGLVGYATWRSRTQKSGIGYIMSMAACIALGTQCALYIAFNLGLNIVWQTTMPFLTSGLFNILTNMALLGLLLNVFSSDGYASHNLPSPLAPKQQHQV